MFTLTDSFAYLLLSFIVLAMTLAFWLRFTWLPTLFPPPPSAKYDDDASKSSPDLLKRHYEDGVISRGTYETVRDELEEVMRS